MKTEDQKSQQHTETNIKGLKSMASRLRAAVDTANYMKGYPEIKPSVRDSSELARDIIAASKILKELAELVKDLRKGQRAFCGKDLMDRLLGVAGEKGNGK